MAGLQLRTGLNASMGGGGSGSYTPLTPASATPPTTNIAQQAYGVNASGAAGYNGNVAWMGSVGVGVVSLALLVYLWWSLPR